jgi:hypothetical protein
VLKRIEKNILGFLNLHWYCKEEVL